MYLITVQEILEPLDGDAEISDQSFIERYRQTVDTVDLLKLTQFVNQKPRKPRTPKPR